MPSTKFLVKAEQVSIVTTGYVFILLGVFVRARLCGRRASATPPRITDDAASVLKLGTPRHLTRMVNVYPSDSLQLVSLKLHLTS